MTDTGVDHIMNLSTPIDENMIHESNRTVLEMILISFEPVVLRRLHMVYNLRAPLPY